MIRYSNKQKCPRPKAQAEKSNLSEGESKNSSQTNQFEFESFEESVQHTKHKQSVVGSIPTIGVITGIEQW